MVWWKFAKFLISFLKAQVIFPSIDASIFSAIKQNSPILFFSSNIMYFVQRKPNKVQILEIFECSGHNLSNSSCQFWTAKSVPLQILHHLSLPWCINPLKILNSKQSSLPSIFVPILSAIKHNFSTLLAQTLYNLVKSSPWKCKFLRLLSSGVKIHQIPYVNFEMTSQFLFRFFIILQCHYL